MSGEKRIQIERKLKQIDDLLTDACDLMRGECGEDRDNEYLFHRELMRTAEHLLDAQEKLREIDED